jgi:hypothetical protein
VYIFSLVEAASTTVMAMAMCWWLLLLLELLCVLLNTLRRLSPLILLFTLARN